MTLQDRRRQPYCTTMPLIDRTAQLAALIRNQFTDSRLTYDKSSAGQRAAQLATPASAPAGRATDKKQAEPLDGQATAAILEQFIVQRIRTLSADDPQRRRKAFRIFMESVLLQEFGLDLINDPGFQQLTDHVLLQMESETQLSLSMREAADALLAQPNDLTPP